MAEERGWAVLDELPVGVGIWTLSEPACMEYANAELLRLMGRGVEDVQWVLGDCFRAATREEQAEMARLRGLGPGEKRRAEWLRVIRDGNGAPSWYQMSLEGVGRAERPSLCYMTLTDVTEARGRQEDYRRKSELYQTVMGQADLMTFEYDLAEDRLECACRTAEGVREQTVLERFARELPRTRRVHPEDLAGLQSVLDQALRGPCHGVVEYRCLSRVEPGYRWLRCFYSGVRGEDGRTRRVAGFCLDVEEEKRLTQRLERAATDGVTGLWNRAAAEERIHNAIREDCRPYAFFIYDVDNFKLVNDTFGHPEGDRLLVRVAQVLRASFREGDVLGRIGGDEFVVLMRNLADPESAIERAGATVRAMRQIFSQEECPLSSSVSLGVAYDAAATHDYQQMYLAADRALYQAKREGKNRHVFTRVSSCFQSSPIETS